MPAALLHVAVSVEKTLPALVSHTSPQHRNGIVVQLVGAPVDYGFSGCPVGCFVATLFRQN